MAYTTAQFRIIEGIRMRSMKMAALVAAGLGLLAGCGAKAPDKAAIEAMIRAHSAAWVDAYNAGDADKATAGSASSRRAQRARRRRQDERAERGAGTGEAVAPVARTEGGAFTWEAGPIG